MPCTQQITTQSPPPTTEQAPSEDEEIAPLAEGQVMDIYNLNYDELQKKII